MPDNVLTPEDVKALAPLYDAVILSLKQVYDPEIPVNIYDLGLIYELNINPAHEVYIKMTFTAPNCPMADEVMADVQHPRRGRLPHRANFRPRLGPEHAVRRGPHRPWLGPGAMKELTLLLGTNLGDRESNINTALAALDRAFCGRRLRQSLIYQA